MNKLDDLLNSITMYRLVLYGLLWLIFVAFLLSLLGILQYSPIALTGSLTVLLTVGFIANMGISKLYNIAPNFESGIITTLILFFVLAVPTNTSQWLAIGIATFVAIASKFIITWRGSHIFNPVAFGVVVATLSGLGFASWWVATPILLPFTLLVGILILRKTRRFGLFLSFLVPSFALFLMRGVDVQTILLSFPLIFFGSIMLTEPATSPSTNKWRLVYGVLIGLIVGAGFGIFSSPQIAILVGNVLAFIVSFRAGTKLELIKKTKLAPNIYDFTFKPHKKLTFLPGQYMDWTLDNIKFNSRGNRRTFTIASSPTQEELHIGVRIYEPTSEFKQKLLSLKKGDTIFGGHVAGDFLLPSDHNKKLVFVAGGIGVTPFISMILHMINTNTKRDITLYYFANKKEDIVYTDAIKKAGKLGLKLVPMIGLDARLKQAVLEKSTPDFKDREFYLSGPPGMVRAYKKSLKKLRVANIHTDYFSGY